MLIISNYHYVRPDFSSKFPSIFGVTPKEFQKQLIQLRKIGDFIKPNDLMKNLPDVLQGKEMFFLITFDDGLKEQIKYARPILEKLDIPAMFFPNSINYEQKRMSTVHKIHLLRSIMPLEKLLKKFSNTNLELSQKEKKRSQDIYIYDDKDSAALKFILNFKMNHYQQEKIISPIFSSYFDEGEKVEEFYMSQKDILDLSASGSLGSHTHSHYPLGLLEPKALKSELEGSKDFFEKLTGENILYVAYPYGNEEACTAEVAIQAGKSGYQIGLTTKRGLNTIDDNPLLLKRFDCNDLPGGKHYKEITDGIFK